MLKVTLLSCTFGLICSTLSAQRQPNPYSLITYNTGIQPIYGLAIDQYDNLYYQSFPANYLLKSWISSGSMFTEYLYQSQQTDFQMDGGVTSDSNGDVFFSAFVPNPYPGNWGLELFDSATGGTGITNPGCSLYAVCNGYVTIAALSPSGDTVYTYNLDGGDVWEATTSAGINGNLGYAQTVLTNIPNVRSMAVDSNGNLYLIPAPVGASELQILKLAPDGTQTYIPITGTGGNDGATIAVNSNGLIVVDDSTTEWLWTFQPVVTRAGTSYTQNQIASGPAAQCGGVAVDTNGNIFCSLSSPGQIEEWIPFVPR